MIHTLNLISVNRIFSRVDFAKYHQNRSCARIISKYVCMQFELKLLFFLLFLFSTVWLLWLICPRVRKGFNRTFDECILFKRPLTRHERNYDSISIPPINGLVNRCKYLVAGWSYLNRLPNGHTYETDCLLDTAIYFHCAESHILYQRMQEL